MNLQQWKYARDVQLWRDAAPHFSERLVCVGHGGIERLEHKGARPFG